MSIAVARQYAQALFDALSPLDAPQAQEVMGELESMEQMLDGSAELRTILLNPAVTPAQKKGVINRLADMAGLTRTRNFLAVVIDRRRIGLFREIREAFEELVSEQAGITRAQVSAPGELAAGQKERIEDALAGLTGGAVRCKYGADASLLGGAVVQIGSTVYDGSIRGQLEALRQRLTE